MRENDSNKSDDSPLPVCRQSFTASVQEQVRIAPCMRLEPNNSKTVLYCCGRMHRMRGLGRCWSVNVQSERVQMLMHADSVHLIES